MKRHRFSYVYFDGELANTGTWHFEAEFTTLHQPQGKWALQWRARHDSDPEWLPIVVEQDRAVVSDAMLETYVAGEFSLDYGAEQKARLRDAAPDGQEKADG
jgi:hypothetical protein